MSLDNILLGMLCEPRSGYDLKAKLDEVVRYFWPAELTQIYRILKRLEGEGLLRSRMIASDKGPDRRVYSVTAAGRRTLHKWLSSEPIIEDERYAALGQLFFMGQLGDLEQSARFMTEMRAKRVAQLEALRELERQRLEPVGGATDCFNDNEFHEYLTLRTGINTMTARIKWCDETIKRIRNRIEQKSHRGKSRRETRR
jgi:DNA-binding PadR family transcriptional regulator